MTSKKTDSIWDEFREGGEAFREAFREAASDPKALVRDILSEYFPSAKSMPPAAQPAALPSRQSAPVAPVQKSSPAKRDTCQICLAEERLANGRMRKLTSTYHFASLDSFSFDPFVLQAEEAHDTARSQGLFGLFRLQGEAWLEERLTDASVRKLQSRQRILEEQQKTTEAGDRLRRAIRADELHDRPQYQQPAIPVAPARPALTASAPLRPSFTNEQIEGAALRALLEGVTTVQRWQPYREALLLHLPPFTVEEIEQRLRDLWRLNPDGPEFV